MENLTDKRILLVEDEVYSAADLKSAFELAGADIIGPVENVGTALRHIVSERIDAALLDIDPNGSKFYPVVDALIGQSVPILLFTGYDILELPERYLGLLCLLKPMSAEALAEAVSGLIEQ